MSESGEGPRPSEIESSTTSNQRENISSEEGLKQIEETQRKVDRTGVNKQPLSFKQKLARLIGIGTVVAGGYVAHEKGYLNDMEALHPDSAGHTQEVKDGEFDSSPPPGIEVGTPENSNEGGSSQSGVNVTVKDKDGNATSVNGNPPLKDGDVIQDSSPDGVRMTVKTNESNPNMNQHPTPETPTSESPTNPNEENRTNPQK